MMIDAIFIQSWHGEIDDGKLEQFLNHLHETPHDRVPVITFVDQVSLQCDRRVQMMKRLREQRYTQFVFVDDAQHNNAQTTVFYHMMRHLPGVYPRVLLLESDCRLMSNFDQPINRDLHTLRDWWVYGSTYYGNGGGLTEADQNSLRRTHMNGVAVYNRCQQFLDYIRLVYETECGLDRVEAYDWLFAMRYFSSEHATKGLLHDSPYIINLSPAWDMHVNYVTRKPLAVIIHQKKPD